MTSFLSKFVLPVWHEVNRNENAASQKFSIGNNFSPTVSRWRFTLVSEWKLDRLKGNRSGHRSKFCTDVKRVSTSFVKLAWDFCRIFGRFLQSSSCQKLLCIQKIWQSTSFDLLTTLRRGVCSQVWSPRAPSVTCWSIERVVDDKIQPGFYFLSARCTSHGENTNENLCNVNPICVC